MFNLPPGLRLRFPNTLRRGLRAAFAAAVPVAAAGLRAEAQSLTTGTLRVTVRDSAGAPLHEAGVSVVDGETGAGRTAITPRDGHVVFQLLPAGTYDVLVEQLSYRPRRVRLVPVGPGATLDLTVSLEPAPPPVESVDTVLYSAGAVLSGRGTGPFRWRAPWEAPDLADPRHELSALTSIATSSSDGLETEGLPGRLSGLVVDGVAHSVARHPAVAPSAFDGAAFPLALLRQAELAASGEDVEWPGFGGSFLSAHSRRGASRLEARATADAGGGSSRLGLVVSGPVVRDTAHLALGAFVRRLESALPPLWPSDSLAAVVAAIAAESAGVFLDSLGYFRPLARRTDVLAAYGRFDWQITPGHVLAARASVADLKADSPDLGPLAATALGASLEARDISGAATLTSRLSERVAQEIRFGVDHSERDYGEVALPTTVIADAGLSLGSSGALPGRFVRTTVRASETVHVQRGAHRFKLGVALSFSSHDHTWADNRGGRFMFAGEDEFRAKSGFFTQTVGTLPVAVFKTSDVALFAQDRWNPAPGLELGLGVRYQRERLPTAELVRSTDWLNRTGLDNTAIGDTRSRLSPRFSFRWSPGGEQRWVLAGSAGVSADEMDPALLGELITHAGAARVRRGVGSLGFWPGLPEGGAPERGPELALLAPDLEAPRTSRAAATISRALGSHAALSVSGAYRHTDFLPRRVDLNLLPAATAADQDGRPVYGSLVKLGTILAATPGSNRRFQDFDLVSAVNADGASDYYGFTIVLERETAGRIGWLASYTYSRTTDNWVGAREGTVAAALPPFADTIQGADWTQGVSDFDVPHRLAIGAELVLSRRFGARFGLLYRYRSGYPFTPGFREGVDANGDGSSVNDPAFVNDTLPGMEDLIVQWDCLRTQIGRFAERNSCREAAVKSLDMRFALRLATLRGHAAELVVDGLNLIRSNVGQVDRALVLVDRSQPLDLSQEGVVGVPLVANPNFGRLLARRSPETVWRFGIRVGG